MAELAARGPINTIVALGFVAIFYGVACLWEWARNKWWY